MGYDMYLRGTRLQGRDDDSYFRLNVWGMSAAVGLMQELGMLCDPEPPTRADWTSLPEYDDDDQEVDGGPEYKEAADKLLAAHNGECPGIPIHKLSSNDGWIVSPPEIRAALANYRTSKAALELPEWWPDWINFLERGEDHDGITIH